MFSSAEEKVRLQSETEFVEGPIFEVGINDTGDHAIEWSVYYYTKEVKSLIKLRQIIRECILKASDEFNISLATPLTYLSVS